jgi:DNA-binding transcriptional regulator YdaS (Cro superfamily)
VSKSVKYYGSSYAKLLKDGSVKACSQRTHFKWLELYGGRRLSKLSYNQVGNYSVETRFSGESDSPDGPHLFWTLEVIKYEGSPSHWDKDPSGGFLTALKDTLALKCGTIQQLFDAQRHATYSEHFATRKEALEAHARMLKAVRRQVRRVGVLPSELSQSLLAQLAYWCEQAWGRQTQVAKAVGVTPQTVNDWLNGRKKMTGEQALRVSAFINSVVKLRRK